MRETFFLRIEKNNFPPPRPSSLSSFLKLLASSLDWPQHHLFSPCFCSWNLHLHFSSLLMTAAAFVANFCWTDGDTVGTVDTGDSLLVSTAAAASLSTCSNLRQLFIPCHLRPTTFCFRAFVFPFRFASFDFRDQLIGLKKNCPSSKDARPSGSKFFSSKD